MLFYRLSDLVCFFIIQKRDIDAIRPRRFCLRRLYNVCNRRSFKVRQSAMTLGGVLDSVKHDLSLDRRTENKDVICAVQKFRG